MFLKQYSKQGLWSLFLICAFPLHVWTIVLALRDFSWVAERTNSWDAIGVISYGLLFAFVESTALFIVAALLGFLVTRHWEEKRRIVLIGSMAIITSLWGMVVHLFYLMQVTVPGQVIDFFVGLEHPLRFLYAISFGVVGATVVFPTYLILRSKKFWKAMNEFFGRLSTLTQFYLFFDFVGLVIVIIRNV